MPTKTLAQLEREWQRYVRKTEIEAKLARKRIPKRVRITTLIQSRAITIYNPKGKRIRNARWGKWETWNEFRDEVLNIRTAISNALQRLKRYRIGTIVYLRKVENGLPTRTVFPVFEAKWGTDGIPFVSWKGHPVAERARRLVKG